MTKDLATSLVTITFTELEYQVLTLILKSQQNLYIGVIENQLKYCTDETLLKQTKAFTDLLTQFGLK